MRRSIITIFLALSLVAGGAAAQSHDHGSHGAHAGHGSTAGKAAAAEDLVRELESKPSADLSDAYQVAALNAVLRALFSLPDKIERDRIGDQVRQYLTGPGRPQILDGFARSETSFAFALRKRRAFERRWHAAVDALIAARMGAPRRGS